MTLETWLLFCSASVLVILIPGPLSLLMVSNSINHGLLRSTPAFIGGVSASLILLTASATGLGALLLATESLFNLIRYAGAAYMIYLGYHVWQDTRQIKITEESEPAQGPDVSAMFWRAFTLGISNPKDILFFVAFLPQFMNLHTSMASQLLVMTTSWCVLDLICKLLYGSSAKMMAPALGKSRNLRIFNKVSAAIFVSVGTAVLLK
jgi:threonine/homoserine/homoserine lactone efflux protein